MMLEHFKIIAWAECPFCVRAKALLIQEGCEFEYVTLDHSPGLLNFYKSTYDMKTVPIIVYFEEGSTHGKVIGGYTDLVDHFARKIG